MAATTEQLGPAHAATLKALLTQDTPHNLYLLGLSEEYGVAPGGQALGTFHGRFVDGKLKAVLFVGGSGGLVVPSASPGLEVTALAQAVAPNISLQTAVGEREAVDALLKVFGARPRHSADQRLFVVSADDLGPFTNPTLRLATEEDLPQLVQMSAGAVQEVMGLDPLEKDPDEFKERVARRVRARRTYVLPVGDKLVFKLDIGSRSQHGAEVESLYTIPSQRRLGHATLSLGQISRHLLSSLPRLALRVNEENGSVARMAQRVGYVAKRNMRMVIA
jgi:hypothetical protein